MDKITLADLEVFYHVGVPAEERAEAQRLVISVEIFRDCSAAIQSDDLSGTTDYFAVAQHLKGLGNGREWRLIETLADEIASLLCRNFGARRARVEVKKFIIPGTRHVSVTVEREASGS